MKLYSLIVVLLTTSLLSNEVSVFGAGDLESSTPYGLTSAEKVLLKNKKKINKFDRKIDATRSNIDTLSQRIEGLETIIDGDTRKLNTNVINVTQNTQNIKLHSLAIQELKQQLTDNSASIEKLYLEFSQYSKAQNKNIKALQKTIKELTTVTNKINTNYVSKKQFDELVTFINKSSKKTKAKVKSTKKAKAKASYNKPSRVLLSEAKALYKKDYFTKAIPIFKHLVNKKYKPAESNYYLGEIWFYRKKYKDAIHYFKTSMMLYDKATYIPKLLLHSAISFEELDDIENAANFYGTLIDAYPQSEEAKLAQEKLSNTQ